jgi:hypothetical protein
MCDSFDPCAILQRTRSLASGAACWPLICWERAPTVGCVCADGSASVTFVAKSDEALQASVHVCMGVLGADVWCRFHTGGLIFFMRVRLARFCRCSHGARRVLALFCAGEGAEGGAGASCLFAPRGTVFVHAACASTSVPPRQPFVGSAAGAVTHGTTMAQYSTALVLWYRRVWLWYCVGCGGGPYSSSIPARHPWAILLRDGRHRAAATAPPHIHAATWLHPAPRVVQTTLARQTNAR